MVINAYMVFSLVAALVCWLLVVMVCNNSRGSAKRESFAWVTGLIGIWSLFPLISGLQTNDVQVLFVIRLVYVPAIFVPSTFFSFMIYVMGLEKENKIKRVLRTSYGVSLVFLAFVFSPLFIKNVSREFFPAYSIIPGPLYVAFILYFGAMYSYASLRLINVYRESKGFLRGQLKYVGIAFAIAFISGIIHFSSAFGIKEVLSHDIFVAIYSIIMAYAILNYRLIDVRIVAVRTLIFLLVYVPILAMPFCLAYWGKAFLESYLGQLWWFIPMGLLAFLGPLGLYLYLYIRKKAEDKIKAKKLKYLKAISDFMEDIKHVRSLNELIDHVLERSKDLIGAKKTLLYLKDRNLPKYVLNSGRNSNGDKVKFESISQAGPLVQYIIETGKPIILEELKLSRTNQDEYLLEDVEKEMDSLDASIVIPSFFGDTLVSFMVLEKQTSHEAYAEEDIEAFDTLGTNVGLALKNAQAMEDLKAVQVDLIASERFAAIGRLATSAKHEINNPLNFISGSMQKTILTMDDYMNNYAKIRERLNAMYMRAKTFLDPMGEDGDEEVKAVAERFSVINEAFEKLEESGKIKEAFYEKMHVYVKKISDIKDDLEAASKKAKDEKNGKTLAEAAHMVRTILINFEKIVDPDKDLKEMVEYGQQGVERIKKVVEAMYNLPKDAGESLNAIKVSELINESFIFVNYQTYWENLGNTPKEVDIPEDLPDIAGYKSKLVGVFSNLIINAYQAMTDAKLASDDQRMIRITGRVCEEDPKFVDIHFANKGPLIPENNIDKIFDQGFTTKKTGTGLGLNICKIQIEVFNKGSISVRNIEGFGPEFIVRLPVWSGEIEARSGI
ncbi:MAG: histidine kinase N-terminal 7TM domain-containing protein [Candidatus Omnitrophota bacterium]